jgi:hypothetical protein
MIYAVVDPAVPGCAREAPIKIGCCRIETMSNDIPTSTLRLAWEMFPDVWEPSPGGGCP